MHFLIRAAFVLAAGAAGWALAKRKRSQAQEETPQVIYLQDEDVVIDAQSGPETMQARVRSCYRRMDPLSLNAANEAIFLLENDMEVKLHFLGDGGLYLKEGDQGMLTWKDTQLIRFEKDNGDVIGGMFYAPNWEETCDE